MFIIKTSPVASIKCMDQEGARNSFIVELSYLVPQFLVLVFFHLQTTEMSDFCPAWVRLQIKHFVLFWKEYKHETLLTERFVRIAINHKWLVVEVKLKNQSVSNTSQQKATLAASAMAFSLI